MELIPRFGSEILTANDVTIHVDPNDRQRIRALVERTSAVSEVYDEASFNAARNAAGELKAKLDEIEAARKATKQAFDAVGRAIQELARDVATPVKSEQDRILGLLAAYVAQLEAARKEQERLEAEARRRVQAEADRRVKEAQEARERVEAALRASQDEAERILLKVEAQQRENQLLQEQLARELADDVAGLGQDQEPKRGLVPGGRVDHNYEFQLVDVNATVRAGCWRLLKWDLDILNCRDSVRAQLELNPNAAPELPGITVTPKLTVSVKAASRIK